MWAQRRFPQDGRDGDDMAAFAGAVAGLGIPNVEINYTVLPEGVEVLLESPHVGISSVHAPCPRLRLPDGRSTEVLNLASGDPEERRLAVERTRATIDCAHRAGAGVVVVHLGGIGSSQFEEEKELRRLYDQGVRDGAEVDALRRRAHERRAEGARAFLPSAALSLREIADHAAAMGVAVGLENRFHYHEFPSVDEAHELLTGYPPDVAGFWLDVGHAEVLDRLGLVPRRRWLDELAPRCIGSHIHDVDGLADHRAPGRGTADWGHFAAKLPRHVPRTLEINQRVPGNEIAASLPFLRERGVL